MSSSNIARIQYEQQYAVRIFHSKILVQIRWFKIMNYLYFYKSRFFFKLKFELNTKTNNFSVTHAYIKQKKNIIQ